jgi:hypothetical protein
MKICHLPFRSCLLSGFTGGKSICMSAWRAADTCAAFASRRADDKTLSAAAMRSYVLNSDALPSAAS